VEGSCDYVEQAVTDCRERVVLQLGEGLGDRLTTHHLKKVAGYEAKHTVPDLARFFRYLRNRMGNWGGGGFDGITLAQGGDIGGAFVRAVMNLWVP